jgi:hypothetical protein
VACCGRRDYHKVRLNSCQAVPISSVPGGGPILDIRVAGPQQHENLRLFPLIARGAPELPYDLLVDALAAGTLSIGELGTGQVPTLVAKNGSERDVLVLDGEQLIGSKQNRITNRSMLLPAGAVTEIPVYCMEQGRWMT